MTTHHPRRYPIVLITGTPGTGKTLHSTLLAQAQEDSSCPFVHLNIGEIVKEKGFHEGWDDEWQSWTVDEDRLLDYLEETLNPEAEGASTGTRIGEETWLKARLHHRSSRPGAIPRTMGGSRGGPHL